MLSRAFLPFITLVCLLGLFPAQAATAVEYPSFYLEFPGGHRERIDAALLTPYLTVHSDDSMSVDTRSLLDSLPYKDPSLALGEGQDLLFEITATGTRLAEHPTPFQPITPLLDQMVLRTLTAPKGKTRVLRIPVEEATHRVLLRSEDGQTRELTQVAHGESDFRGSSPARLHNIQTAMARFQGARILPGEIFSFNTLLGEVDGTTGYKKELVIKGDRTLPDYGGGVCQVSSTVYRAALDAGFPIVERKPHSYAVSYYLPWGTDATIYPGIIDLRFSNNFADPVYLHFVIAGTTLHTYMYGTSDGRSVSFSGPNTYAFTGAPNPKVEYTTALAPGKRVWKEYGRNGFSAWWERSITSSTGAVMTEKIISTYEPRGGFVLEGQGAQLPLPE